MSLLTARASLASVLVVLAALASCTFPHDPDGSLERIDRTGELRVGVSPAQGRTVVPEEGDPSGPEVRLVTGFARSRGAEVRWTTGGEEELMGQLETGELDMVIGGLTDQSPWTKKAGLTRPYAETTDSRGEQVKLVMAVPLGENRLMSELERWLDGSAEQ